jgi:flagellar P-ring protein FlgI
MNTPRSLVTLLAIGSAALCGLAAPVALGQSVTLKGLGRFDGWRENALIGQGIVVGLAGSGDSSRSAITRQSLLNVYSRLGISVNEADLSSRNVAVVIVVASLPASANIGDRLSATVSSTGDARSLAGGTLLMTPLYGPNRVSYGLAQGPVLTGGYAFEADSNRQQRNYPTTARLESGVTVEKSVEANLIGADGTLSFLLHSPSFTTAERIASAINGRFGASTATAISADEVKIRFSTRASSLTNFVSDIESVQAIPDVMPRVVINERTGTVVAGGDVRISPVVIAQGDIRVTVRTQNTPSQPSFIAGLAPDVRSLVVSNTDLNVEQGRDDVLVSFGNSSVVDLVQGLSRAKVDTRRMISILQAIKSAGALNAEIVVQ